MVQIRPIELPHPLADHLDDAQDLPLIAQGRTEQRARGEARAGIYLSIETPILCHIRHDHRFVVLQRPPGNTGARGQLDTGQPAGLAPQREGEDQFPLSLSQQNGALGGVERLGRERQNLPQHSIGIERGDGDGADGVEVDEPVRLLPAGLVELCIAQHLPRPVRHRLHQRLILVAEGLLTGSPAQRQQADQTLGVPDRRHKGIPPLQPGKSQVPYRPDLTQQEGRHPSSLPQVREESLQVRRRCRKAQRFNPPL